MSGFDGTNAVIRLLCGYVMSQSYGRLQNPIGFPTQTELWDTTAWIIQSQRNAHVLLPIESLLHGPSKKLRISLIPKLSRGIFATQYPKV